MKPIKTKETDWLWCLEIIAHWWIVCSKVDGGREIRPDVPYCMPLQKTEALPAFGIVAPNQNIGKNIFLSSMLQISRC